jgi:hypothetical protein
MTETSSLDVRAFRMGPLSVELIDARGRTVGRRVLLSSSERHAVIEDVPRGSYILVATRPSGERLTQAVDVEGPRTVAIVNPAGPSPHEFMTEASDFGLIPTRTSPAVPGSPVPDVGLFSVIGAAGRNLAALSIAPKRVSRDFGIRVAEDHRIPFRRP